MHKMVLPLVISSVVGFSAAAYASVDVVLHRDVALVVENGEKAPLRLVTKSEYQLENGQNQLVVRLEKLIRSSYGEPEKFNSETVVITFDAHDEAFFLKPNFEVKTKQDSEKFKQKPNFSLISQKTEQPYNAKMDFLIDGGGITRDYELEVARYNVKNDIELSLSLQAALKVAKKKSNDIAPNDMIEHWYVKATGKDQKKFTDFAFKSRKNDINLLSSDSSKELEMMVYWYNEASAEQKKNIVNWLFEK